MYYNISFEFTPLSHTALTIAFAFSWHFYMVLYLLVGFISIVDMIILLLYHRLTARPKQGHHIAKFKFFSYIKLLIPPAFYGMMLAIIPVLLINLVIAILVSGHLLSISTAIYSCDNPGGESACIYTLFD